MAQTKIRVDEFGRRRTDHSGSSTDSQPQSITDAKEQRQDSKNPENEGKIAQMAAKIAALEAKLDAFMSFVNNSSVCGQGFSGTIASGISFDPSAIQTGNGGGNVGQPYSLTLCDGTVIVVSVTSITPPP